MRNLFMCFLALSLCSCNIKEKSKKAVETKTKFSEVEIQTLLQDSTLNVRAIEIDEHKNGISFASSDGRIGNISLNETSSFGASLQIKHDTKEVNFRSSAITQKGGFLLSISSPTLLYKSTKDSLVKVYQENHPKAFYDAVDFWNDKEGIAMGDPTDDCISIIITRDGGNTWDKLSCDFLPKAKEGEAAFAASDTNIAIVGDETWVATGGMTSRILYSRNKGETWEVFDTPIIQGKPTTGMYSLNFYDNKNGFAIGGDYTDADGNTANKIRTTDGGKTWQTIADGKNPGYRSCVQYVPNSNARALVAIGFNGIDYSNDAGESWQHLSDEGFYTLRFLNDSTAYAAGKGRISKLIFR